MGKEQISGLKNHRTRRRLPDDLIERIAIYIENRPDASDHEVAKMFRVDPMTIWRIRKRYIETPRDNEKPSPVVIQVADIVHRPEEYRHRAGPDPEEKLAVFRRVLQDGDFLPPVTCSVVDGKYILVDGFCSYQASKAEGKQQIHAFLYPEDEESAFRRSICANEEGVKRSAQDRLVALDHYLERYPEAREATNATLARAINANKNVVASLRANDPERFGVGRILPGHLINPKNGVKDIGKRRVVPDKPGRPDVAPWRPAGLELNVREMIFLRRIRLIRQLEDMGEEYNRALLCLISEALLYERTKIYTEKLRILFKRLREKGIKVRGHRDLLFRALFLCKKPHEYVLCSKCGGRGCQACKTRGIV